MKIEKLPNYSSERYYLLSEIEQKCKVLNLDTMKYHIQPHEKFSIAVYYLLWNVTTFDPKLNNGQNLIEDLIDKFEILKETTEGMMSQESCKLIIVEVLISKRNQNEKNYFLLCESLLEILEQKHNTVNVCLGLCDNIAGTPGLEKTLDYLISLQPHSSINELFPPNENIFIIAVESKEFLGHDPFRDPDAASNLVQFICYHKNFEYQNFVANSVKIVERCEKMKKMLEHCDEVKEKIKEEYLHDDNFYLTFFTIFFLLIAVLVYNKYFRNV
jgi:hypothetical protein